MFWEKNTYKQTDRKLNEIEHMLRYIFCFFCHVEKRVKVCLLIKFVEHPVLYVCNLVNNIPQVCTWLWHKDKRHLSTKCLRHMPHTSDAGNYCIILMLSNYTLLCTLVSITNDPCWFHDWLEVRWTIDRLSRGPVSTTSKRAECRPWVCPST